MSAVQIAFVALAALTILWFFPKLQVRRARRSLDESKISLSDLMKAENDRRTTLAQILGGLAVLTGLYFTSQTLALQQAGQLTDRISKSVEQLGSDKAEVRLGGIHQIGRILSDSESDRWPLLHVLTAFVEDRSPLRSATHEPESCDPYRVYDVSGLGDHEVQAVADVLRKQSELEPKGNDGIDSGEAAKRDDNISIVRSNLRSLDLSDARLGRAQFARDDMTGAILVRTTFSPNANLNFTNLAHADLRDSHLTGVHLEVVCMTQANLRSADFSNAHLDQADMRKLFDSADLQLQGASMRETDLRNADLTLAKGLTADQITSAKVDCRTKLPKGLEYLLKSAPCGP